MAASGAVPALIALAGTLAQAGAGYAASRGGRDPQATGDIFSHGFSRLGVETEEEKRLALLQALLGMAGMQQARTDMLGAPSMADILAGRISPDMSKHLDMLSFGGLEEAGRMANRYATERALGQGMDMSSLQNSWYAQAMQPAMIQAMQMRSALQLQEVERMQRLRQTAMGNALAMQESPTLSRLLQIRGAEAQTSQMQLGREARGDRLPTDVYNQMLAHYYNTDPRSLPRM